MPDSTAVSVLRGVRGFLAPLLDLLGPSEHDTENATTNTPPPQQQPLPMPLPDIATLAEAIRRHAEELLETWAVRGGLYEAYVRVLFAFLAEEQLELEVRGRKGGRKGMGGWFGSCVVG